MFVQGRGLLAETHANDWVRVGSRFHDFTDLLVRTGTAIGKPVVGILRSGRMARMMGVGPESFMVACYKRGVGAYPSVTRAAHTVAQILEWRAGRDGLPDLFDTAMENRK